MACRWTVRGAERFTLPKAQSRPEHMAGWFRYDPAIRAWLWNFLDIWLAHDKRGVARAARRLTNRRAYRAAAAQTAYSFVNRLESPPKRAAPRSCAPPVSPPRAASLASTFR